MNGLALGVVVTVWGGPYVGTSGVVAAVGGHWCTVRVAGRSWPLVTQRAWVEAC